MHAFLRPLRAQVSMPVGAVVGLALGCVLVPLLVLYAVYRRQRKRHRNMFGQVRPPGATPQTTLLITDIQSSTILCECTPPPHPTSPPSPHTHTPRLGAK